MHYCLTFSDIFTQISDSSGLLVRQKFEQYLQDILALPTAVFEGPSFGYNDTAVRACFDMVVYLFSMAYLINDMISVANWAEIIPLLCFICMDDMSLVVRKPVFGVSD